MEICQERVLTWFQSRLEEVSHTGTKKDSKTQLQEYLQAHKSHLPVYLVLSVDLLGT